MNDEELVKMIERMIATDDLLLDTPFLRRLREEGREAGFEEGREEGHKEGREEGRENGREEGELIARRRDLLDVLVLRFDPPFSFYQQTEQRLLDFSDDAQLKKLFTTAVQCEDVKAFQTAMENINGEKGKGKME
ncbi:MAG: hypothetical protein DRR19_01915 [Candidatus Parabeggiatoa sp. nov. 1]|nr:MAG: hypothetical protein DRR19_01915 [Gammaproteobacteria bacterium]